MGEPRPRDDGRTQTKVEGSRLGAAYRGARDVLPRTAQLVLDVIAAALTGRQHLASRWDRLRRRELVLGLLRRWVAPERLFVGWILHANEDGGGARVHGLLPHAYLRTAGVNSVILRKPREHIVALSFSRGDLDRLIRARLDVVVFQGVSGPIASALATELRAAGTRTVYVTGDLIGHDITEAVDWFVAASEELTKVGHPNLERTSVIESVIDAPHGLVKKYSQRRPSDRIRVVWVGYPENLPLLAPVREALTDSRLARYELVTISRGAGVTYQWHRKRVFEQILGCDIAVLPVAETDWYRAKPNTRMTMFKSLGIPIIASPIDSYVRTLTHGRSCYFAQTTSEWKEALRALRDPVRRREIGLADRERILATYGLEAVGQKWLALFRMLVQSRS